MDWQEVTDSGKVIYMQWGKRRQQLFCSSDVEEMASAYQ